MDNGVRLYRGGDMVAALAEFEAAYAAKPGPSPLVNQALCHRDRFHYVRAIAALERAIASHGVQMSPGDRRVIEDSLRELRALLAFVRITVDPADAVVAIDGEDLPPGSIQQAVPLGPGPHRVVARANGRVPQEERLQVASGEERAISFSLPFATGAVRVTARSPSTPIEIDGEVVGRGNWSGALRAGRHEVRLVGEGTALTIDVAPGEALDVRGEAGSGEARGLPAPPPPPLPPSARTDRAPTGPYGLLAGSLLVPVAGPSVPVEASNGISALLASRGGWRVAPFAAFELVGALGGSSGETSDGATSWSRTSLRGGVGVRLFTTGRTVRLVGALGGGLGWDQVDFEGGGVAYDGSGFDPFGVAEIGLEAEMQRVLLGVALEAWVDGVTGITDGTGRKAWDGPVLPAFGPSLRAGYALW